MERERTEKQIEATKKNLAKGRQRFHRWSDDERRVLAFPFGHMFPELDSKVDPVALLRWQMAGARISDGSGKSPADQTVVGWREENREARVRLLRTSLFRSRTTISSRKLLQGLVANLDGWPERRRLVEEMIENFQVIVDWAAVMNYRPPEGHAFAHGITPLKVGEVSKGIYSGIPLLRPLSDPDAEIHLVEASHLAPIIVAFHDTFRSKSATCSRNAKVGVERRKISGA